MAISTYTELKSAIGDFLNRQDLDSVIPTFIALAEADINRSVRHWRMEERSSGQQSGGDQYMQIPADWVETIRMHVVGDGTSPINLASIATIADKRARKEDEAGVPTLYAHVRGEFELYPTPVEDTDIELVYYKKLDALGDAQASNWLLSEAPDVYLYGSLLHSAPYLADDARLAVWAQMYSAAVQNLNDSGEKAQFSGSGLKLKLRGMG
jgi:hypothetical protein